MTMRCKFKCSKKIEIEYGFELEFEATTEDNSYFRFTPYGTLKVGLVSRDTADAFKVGEYYFLNLEPTDDPQASFPLEDRSV